MTFDKDAYRSLYPFESHYFDRDGLRYHYLDEGQGEPLIMLHGNPTWSFYFRALVKGLRDRYRIIVPDHIGCGLSDKPDDSRYEYRLKNRVDDLEALLNHLGLEENLTLIAHDWGGMIAYSYALRDPSRIRRLVMMNTAAFMLPAHKKLPLRLWLMRMIRPFATFSIRGFNLFARAATWMATKKGLPPEVKKALLAPYDSWQNRIAILKFVQDIPLSAKDPSYEDCRFVEENLDRLKDLPLLIAWGTHDFVFDLDFLAEWERRCPHAEIHRFEQASHYILEDVPDDILSLIDDFLQRHPLEN